MFFMGCLMFSNFRLSGFPAFMTRSRRQFLSSFTRLLVEEFGKKGIVMKDPADLATYYTSEDHFKFAKIFLELSEYHLKLECYVEIVEDDMTDLIPHDVRYCHRNIMYPYIGIFTIDAGLMFPDRPLTERYSPAYAEHVVESLIEVAKEIEKANERARSPEFMNQFRRVRELRSNAAREESQLVRALR